jgi:hypothetical protein
VNKSWVFDCFIIKAVCWSPFLGWEFYDLIFEHIYLDVQYQLNQIRPGEDYVTLIAKASQQKNKSIAALVILEDGNNSTQG